MEPINLTSAEWHIMECLWEAAPQTGRQNRYFYLQTREARTPQPMASCAVKRGCGRLSPATPFVKTHSNLRLFPTGTLRHFAAEEDAHVGQARACLGRVARTR